MRCRRCSVEANALMWYGDGWLCGTCFNAERLECKNLERFKAVRIGNDDNDWIKKYVMGKDKPK